MKILLVAATKHELGSPAAYNNLISNFPEIKILITGIGMVKTTYFLTVEILRNKPDFVINIGLCGSFNKNFDVGSVVNVLSEDFADFGIDNNGKFIPLHGKNKISSFGKLKSNFANKIELPLVKGITVNTVNSQKKIIEKVIDNFHPDIESMEVAAVFYVCMINNIPFIEIRAVSNMVEPRDIYKWNIPLAINNLNSVLPEIILKIKNNLK